jgi:phytoene desaturase
LKNAVIIGSGIAGIAASIRLKAAGFDVAVYEQQSQAGGKIASLKLNDYRFDTGPSLFTMPQFIEDLFALASEPIEPHFAYKKKDVVCNYFFSTEKKFVAHADRVKFVDEACKTFQVRKKPLEKYLDNCKKKYDLTTRLFLEKSLHKLSTYLSTDTLNAIVHLPILHLNSTLNDVNEMYFSDKDLIQFFNRYATYNGSSPYLTPGIMSLIPHLEQHYGTYFPQGGMISITNSLVFLAEKLGVTFYFNHNIEKIEIENNKAIGIWSTGKFIQADVVISNMDIVPTYKKLMPNTKHPKKILSQERSSSALIFYWGIKKVFNQLDLHNIFFAENYQQEFNAIFNKKTIGDDITIYLNISSKDNIDDAPLDCENWFILVNAPNNTNQDWDELIDKTRRNVITKLSKHLKVDVSQFIECESVLDPRSIESKTQSYQGSLYGASSNSKFAAFLRHPNFSSRIKNLYFCGGSVHPGGGIPLCLLSAKITTDLIQHEQKNKLQ